MSLVGVTLLRVNAIVLDDVLKRIVHQTSFTSLITLGSCLKELCAPYINYHTLCATV